MKPITHTEPHQQTANAVPTSTLLAFTFWLAWGWALNSRALLPSPTAEAELFMRQIDALYVVIWLAALLALALLARRISPLYENNVARYGAPVLVTLGTAAEVISGWGVYTQNIGLTVGTIATAIGSAALLVMWGECAVAAGFKRASVAIAASFALAALAAYLVVNLRPTVALVTLALLPLGTGFLLWFGPRTLPVSVVPVAPVQSRRGNLRKWLLGAVCIGLAFGLSNGLTKTEGSSSLNAYFLLASGIGALAILVSVRYLSRSLDYFALYRTVAPIMAAGLLLLSLPGVAYWAAAQVAIAVAWVLIRIFTLTILTELTPRLGLTAVSTFAWTQFALSAGREAGWLLSKDAAQTGHELLVVVAGAVLLTVVTVTLLVNERDLVTMLGESARALMNAGSGVSCTRVASALAADFELSPRQEEVVCLVIQGHDNPTIQKDLHIAGSTLKAHLRDIYAKTGVHSRQELLELCATYAARLQG